MTPSRSSTESSPSSRTRRTARWRSRICGSAKRTIASTHERKHSPPTSWRRRYAPIVDTLNIKRDAAEHRRKAPNPRHAEAFRLALDGWRELERKDTVAAASSLERALALNSRDPVARYRYGRVLEARRDDPAALVEFEHAIREARNAPAPIIGEAFLEAGRIHERAGRRKEAIAAFQSASSLFGASAETHLAASRALARLLK